MKRFNTFEGVFTPCLLSILGVIMYLRLGWVVGQVGLGAALIIIVLANLITLATGLSISSIVTNIRIGVGGAHSIIAKSLGVEAGGAIGIPLYLSQAISVAFYISGFTECWVSVFPAHSFLQVSLITWFVLMVISTYSAKLAFRLQYVIMGLIALSLLSIYLGWGNMRTTIPLWEGLFSGNFWPVFAIFFPAVTGILVGSAMSGELIDPKKSIPRGTLSAIGLSFFIYVSLAFWFAHSASAEQLTQRTSIVIDLGRWRLPVILGIMGATLSSAMSMFVGAPRTMVALGKHGILPFSRSLSRINQKGEPVAAILLTALLVLVTLLAGTLDKVAALLTMFFLITYGMINFSVFVEQSMGIPSFRPSIRIPRAVSFFGTMGCLGAMFLINPVFSLIAITLIVGLYFFLVRREIEIYSPDVRSGLLIALAERMARLAAGLPYHPKIWKPNLFIPVHEVRDLPEIVPFLSAILAPAGRAHFLKIIEQGAHWPSAGPLNLEHLEFKRRVREELDQAVDVLKTQRLFIATGVAEAPNMLAGCLTWLQGLKTMFFPPNTFFCCLPAEMCEDGGKMRIIKEAAGEGYGVIVLKYHPQNKFGRQQMINLWIRQGSPNVDLAVLVALQLQKNWDARLRLIQAVNIKEDIEPARAYLERLKDVIRMPSDVDIGILFGEFRAILRMAPTADVNIFGMGEEFDLSLMHESFEALGTSILFLKDSRHESAVA